MSPEHESTLGAIRDAVAAAEPAQDRLQRAMVTINQRHPKYEWVGVYVLRGDRLELGPYVGAPTEHTRIPVGRGVCGTAIAERANQVIEDVRALDNYLACSASVRSEIVVLIWDGDEVLGQIDADCDEVGAFDRAEEKFITEVASMLMPLVADIR